MMIIKREESWQPQHYYCLNPFCLYPHQRRFTSQQSHNSSKQCSKWIVNLFDQSIADPTAFTNKEIDDLELNFAQAPLKAIEKVVKLKKSDWKKWLVTQQNRVKKQLVNAIQVQFQTVRVQIEQIILNCAGMSELVTFISSSERNCHQISQFFEQHHPNLEGQDNCTLFQRRDFRQRINTIKTQIKGFFSSFVNFHSEKTAILSQQQQKNLHNYIFQPTECYYNKYQVVAAGLNRKANSYSINGQKIELECFLCDRKVSSRINPANKKIIKKQLVQQILNHLYCGHYQHVAFAYVRKIAKEPPSEITFCQFVRQSKYSEIIRLIDRESGVAFQQTFEQYEKNRKAFSVQVLSLSNQHMIKGRHLLVSCHQSIDLMMSIMAYICTQRGQDVVIESKKESLRGGLKQILELQNMAQQQSKLQKHEC